MGSKDFALSHRGISTIYKLQHMRLSKAYALGPVFILAGIHSSESVMHIRRCIQRDSCV